MKFYFNKSVTINNPVRIFFLCGSHYYDKPFKVHINGTEYEIFDKRKVLQAYLEETYASMNFKTIILEDNFMFRDSKKHLNYNDINLKSLKSIELLTSMYSDYIFVVHESFSTAAEIGMFSTSEIIKDKLMILTPNEYSVEENYISGFMKLAYQNKFDTSHNIKTVYYNPGIYNFHVSDQLRKLHTFFIDNKVKGALEKNLSEYLSVFGEKNVVFGKKQMGRYKTKISNTYQVVEPNKLKVVFNTNDLFSFLISLFNIDELRREFKLTVDMSHLRTDKISYKRKSLFKKGTETVEKYFKQAIYNTIKTDIPNIEDQYGNIEDLDKFIDFSIESRVVDFKVCISFFLYILCALTYIKITDDSTRFSISNSFSSVYQEYKDLIQEVRNTKEIWSR